MKDKSFSSYIFPVRDNHIAVVKYGENAFGPIGGRLDENENFIDALHREIVEEIGTPATKMLSLITEIPVPYCFKHQSMERAQKRGALSEEHHFFITHKTDDIDFNFIENNNTQIVWIKPSDLLDPTITPFDDLREYYAKYIIPNIMCKFSMSVMDRFYQLIKSGHKDIELRLYDDKRKNINIGDNFLFFNADNKNEYLICNVLQLHHAKTFESLLDKIDSSRTGCESREELIEKIKTIYPISAQEKLGVIGIELKVIK